MICTCYVLCTKIIQYNKGTKMHFTNLGSHFCDQGTQLSKIEFISCMLLKNKSERFLCYVMKNIIHEAVEGVSFQFVFCLKYID